MDRKQAEALAAKIAAELAEGLDSPDEAWTARKDQDEAGVWHVCPANAEAGDSDSDTAAVWVEQGQCRGQLLDSWAVVEHYCDEGSTWVHPSADVCFQAA